MSGETATSNIVSVSQAAHTLGVSERTVWRKIKAGQLPTVDIHGKTCVQLAVSDNATDSAAEAVTAPGVARQNVSDSQTEELLREIIHRQDEVIKTLRADMDDIKELTRRMLPASNSNSEDQAEHLAMMQTHTELYNALRQPKPQVWPWIIAGVSVLCSVAAVVLALLR